MPGKRQLISLLVALCLMFAAAGVAYADLKTQYVAYSWDIVVDKFQNSNVQYPFDGTWESFFHRFDYDKDPYTIPITYQTTLGCQNNPISKFAGTMEFGLGHTDSDSKAYGAPGFQESRNWEIANCSRDGDTDFDNGDLAYQPRTYRATIADVNDNAGVWLVSKDIERNCSQNTCLTEIVTTLFINFDLDCDGTIDPQFDPPAGVCFYAEARVPPPPEPVPWWAGNLQTRITYGGGDKTVNFSPMDPITAVSLSSFTAAWTEAASQPLTWWAGAAVLGAAAAGAVTWRLRRARS
jgi:hypothetical protein